MINYLKNRSEQIRRLLLFFLCTLLIIFFYRVRATLLPFGFGILFTYIFNPIVCYMQNKGFPRQGAIILIIIIVFNILFISSLIFLPSLIKELEGLAGKSTFYLDEIREYLLYLDQQYHAFNLLLPEEITTRTSQFLEGYLKHMLTDISNLFLDSLTIIFSLIMAPIISYYLLLDLEKFKDNFFKFFSLKNKKVLLRIMDEINNVMIGYFRGQLWISFLVTIISSIGLYLFEVRFYLVLGVLAGLTNMIPYIGPFLGAVPAVIIAFFNTPFQALLVSIFYILIQQIESSVLAPRILSNKVGLHPVVIIFSLLVSINLLGGWGMVLAVPLAGIVKVIGKGLFELLIPLNQKPL
ncbi:MAG: AI-2E family transporter [Halanaerobiales bacterium]